LPPDVIVMHPRRWGWFLSLLDQQQRPLFLPVDNAPMNAAGILTDVDSQQVVGRTRGLPIVPDPNLPVNLGTANNEDPIFVMRASDLVLFESGIRARVMPETKAQTLTVILQVYSYISGADIKTVQARMRHATARTTLDTYGHLWPDADESTRTAVGAVIAERLKTAAYPVRTESPSS
jgi:hypothetical protein